MVNEPAKDVKNLAAMFERKSTVKLYQDKKKFLSNIAAPVKQNPYEKKEAPKPVVQPPLTTQKPSDKPAEVKAPNPFG